MPEVTFIELSRLQFGHEFPGANINSRVDGRETEIDQLAASIKAEGLLQPLLVTGAGDDDDCLYVIDGNRRLAALRKVYADSAETKDLIPCSVAECGVMDALRKSLIANDTHVPLHPVDRHAAFASCFDKGESVTAIASRYAVSERAVRQSLALGQLAPAIRSDWRRGKIDADTAKAFTLIEGHEAQTRIYNRLKKERGDFLHRWDVFNAANRASGDLGKLLALVGREAYEAAGGHLIEDLFTGMDDDDDNEAPAPAVANPEILQKLAQEKIDAKIEELTKAGWSWAAFAPTLPNIARWSWERNGATAKKASVAQKAESGCIVDISDAGKFEIQYGVVKPGAKKAAEKAKADKKKGTGDAKVKDAAPEPAEISQSLAADLIEQKTRAAAKALTADLDAALAVLLAGFLSQVGPVKVECRGLDNNSISKDDFDFTGALKRTRKMSRDEVLEGLSRFAAKAIDLRGGTHGEIDALIEVIPPDAFNKAMSEEFALQDFLDRAPKGVLIEAADEVGTNIGNVAGMKKSAIPEAIIATLRKQGWLPRELRTAHYLAPGAKKQPKKSAKKKGGKK